MHLMWKLAAVVQDPKIEVDINTPGNDPAWYSAWWIWVLVALFIIIIVAITSRGKATD